VKSNILQQYLGSDYNIANNSTMNDSLRRAIVSQYITKSMVNSSDKPLVQYFNKPDGSQTLNLDTYKKGMVNQFLYAKQTNMSYFDRSSSDFVSYYTFLSTIKYLSENNSKVFIKYLRNLIGTSSDTDLGRNVPSYIV
jgi:hypothetical protein